MPPRPYGNRECRFLLNQLKEMEQATQFSGALRRSKRRFANLNKCRSRIFPSTASSGGSCASTSFMLSPIPIFSQLLTTDWEVKYSTVVLVFRSRDHTQTPAFFDCITYGVVHRSAATRPTELSMPPSTPGPPGFSERLYMVPEGSRSRSRVGEWAEVGYSNGPTPHRLPLRR